MKERGGWKGVREGEGRGEEKRWDERGDRWEGRKEEEKSIEEIDLKRIGEEGNIGMR